MQKSIFTIILIDFKDAIPQTTISYFSEVNEKALFAFAYKSGPIVLIKEVEENGKFSVLELSHDNLVSKFFTNFAGILRYVTNFLINLILKTCF